MAAVREDVSADNKTEETTNRKKDDSVLTNLDNNSNTFIVSKNKITLPEESYSESKFAPALVGLYFVPGIGEGALTATGVVRVGGIASTIYNLVKNAVTNGKAKKKSSSGHTTTLNGIKKRVPNSLKKKNGNVDIDSFVNRKG